MTQRITFLVPSLSNRFALLLIMAVAAMAVPFSGARSGQSVVALVNDEPISTFDLENRQRFLAATSGFGDAMQKEVKAALSAPDIQERFKTFVRSQPQPPQSQEEVKELQAQFVKQIQQGIQKRLLGARMSSARKQALDDLIEERLMLQDAKLNKIVVTDDDVMKSLTRKSADGKVEKGPEDLFKQLRGMNIDPKTYIEKKRSQLAWVQLIRKLYGYRIFAVPTGKDQATGNSAEENAVYDLRVVKVAIPANSDQKAIGHAWNKVDNLRQRFSSCDKLSGLAELTGGASVYDMQKAAPSKLVADARSVVIKAGVGQMTPPVILKNAVESYAVCKKHVQKAKTEGGNDTQQENKRQQEFQIYARRHLTDLKTKAHVEYR